jgi:DNA-binding NarL/FixJ family response regulator
MVDDEHEPHATTCPVCDGSPRILVVMRHPAMLRFTRELLERECGCWVATEASSGPSLAMAIERLAPDLAVVDYADFPACCLARVAQLPPERVIVIGPEPDTAYRAAALLRGAGSWIARDDVADLLASEMRRLLGCAHDPCPPTGAPQRDSVVPSDVGVPVGG